MRKIFTIVVLLIFGLSVHAADRYIATTGSNSNAGTLASPWATLSWACAHSTSPDLIHVGAGTFTETSQCVLPVGVSIIGQGVTSIIKAGYVGSTAVGLLTISSSAGTPLNGNQTVSNLEFDGNGQTGHCAISSNYRNNVTITNCTILNFSDRGVSFANGGDFVGAPSYYTSGNSVHDCIVTNCGHADPNNNYSYASLYWYGQTGFYIYNCTVNNTAQSAGNSDLIRCAWQSGSKVYNNVFTKPFGDNGGYWNFYSELFFTIGQFDIYGNTFNGNAALDFVDVRPGTGNWMNIYNNLWTNPSPPTATAHSVMSIDFEDYGAVQNVKIYNNHFKNVQTGVLLDPTGNTAYGAINKVLISGQVYYEQIYIYYNLFENIGSIPVTGYAPASAIDIKPDVNGGTEGVIHVANIYVDNNTIISGSTYKGYAGVLLETLSDMTNIYVRNNIIQGFSGYPVYYYKNLSTPSGSTHYIQDNLAYGNSGGNSVGFYNVTISGINYTPSGGIYSTSNPLFVSSSDFHLQSTSPAINAGIHITTPAVTTDYAGVTIGSPYPEIGAYEYVGGYTLATVTTTAITSITTTTASSGGNVTADGGATVTARGVCYGTSTNPTIANNPTTSGTGTGSFISSITGLAVGTTYHVRAYATNAVGTTYGTDIQFTTLAAIPTVTTTAVTGITTTTATSGGNVTADGGATVTARGVCVGTIATPTLANSSFTTNGTSTGTFVSALSGLTSGTFYYVRAYATNSAGTAYGSTVTFTTTVSLTLPVVTTADVSSITPTTATSGGTIVSNGGSSITVSGICWGTAVNPTTSNSKTIDGTTSGNWSDNITGLTQNTSYHVRAYATNSVGTSYGSDIQFTSLLTTSIYKVKYSGKFVTSGGKILIVTW